MHWVELYTVHVTAAKEHCWHATDCYVACAAAAAARLMWNKHWEHHNQCGEPHADPDFHQGRWRVVDAAGLLAELGYLQFCNMHLV